jgi:histidinol phosphatase-like enzyme (inositol monophosphatase family)
MDIENELLNQLSSFANQIADKSGEVVRRYYRNLNDVEAKEDSSPVTIADREAEKTLRKMINQKYPEHGIQGEEFGIENEGAEYKWIIDPIDGTLSFMIGRPIFGTLIGLLKNNEPILGVIDQPINNERWVGASNSKTKFNDKTVEFSNCQYLKDATLCTTAPNYYTPKKLAIFNEIASKAKYNIYGGDCYNYGLAASGNVDVVLDSGLKQHDFLPIIPIIKGSGGIISDWNGNDLDINSNGDIIICSNKNLHDEILKVIND